ncbi:MAG TPA: phosphatase PAP2 family protein [Jiangellaceae bacterium]
MAGDTAVGAREPRWAAATFGFVLFLAGSVGTWLCWRYFVDTYEGQLVDDAALRGSVIGQNLLWRAAEPVLDVVSVSFVVLVLSAAALIAVMRRRLLLAIQVTVLVGGANLTTQTLKHTLLERPQLAETGGALANSLPSGHTTVAASVAAALLLVVPRGIRPLVAVLAAGYTATTGIATVIGGWHRPSDAVAAVTVVLAWAGLTAMLTALVSPEWHRPGPPAGRSTAVAAGLLGAGGLAGGVLAAAALLRIRNLVAMGDVTPALMPRQDLATAYVGGALGIAAVTAVVYAAILLAHQFASHDPERSRPRAGASMA